MGINAEIEIDLSYLEDVAGGNSEFMVEMIDIFQAQTPVHFKELTSAVESHDWKRIAELAHKIKPTLVFVGVDSVKDEMAEIEMNARKEENFEFIAAKVDELHEVFDILFAKLELKRQEFLAS